MNLKNQRGKQPSGRRKAAQKATNKENTPCIMDTSPHPRPRPRPIRKDDNPSSKPSGGHTDIIETWQAPNSKEVMAAKALLNFNRHAASENTMDPIFRQVLKIPLDEALDDEGSEDQDGHEMEEVQPSDSEEQMSWLPRLGLAPVAPPSPSPTPKCPATNDIVPENPCLQDWLEQLDVDHICGKLNLNYSQFLEPLISNGFYELSDIAHLSVEKLLRLSNGKLNFGIANCLINYAKEDYLVNKHFHSE
ncbi:hypothetical protein E4T56_gene12827 [Termitomyces sp. T112]|nr:hypothetical protein E4T56_gene12827 [Termitomyces sp. T112]